MAYLVMAHSSPFWLTQVLVSYDHWTKLYTATVYLGRTVVAKGEGGTANTAVRLAVATTRAGRARRWQ